MSFLNIVIAILAFGVLILIHELGHFILAKLNDVKVEEFSIGMGPKLLGIQGKETQYSIRVLPIGGYVKMLGDETKSEDPRAFNNKSSGRRLSIVVAGPIMNLVLAAVLFCIVGTVQGIPLPTVAKPTANSPAQKIGIKAGDTIVKINNYSVHTWEDISFNMALNKGESINVALKRDGVLKKLTLKPEYNKKEKLYIMGIYPKIIEKPTIMQGAKYGASETVTMIKTVYLSLKMMVTGKASAKDVSGPVSIIKVTGAAANAGFIKLINFIAFISAQLGVMNLLPIPALDGGYVLLFLFQMITGKKVDDDKVGFINTIGFALLMLLMVVVTIKDLVYPINF
ncbi:RIP metalloprotease RseP [Clostridium felsineum]|uniref:Zinc metalloprotease n=1 Tax=Clostridium felsineum TaxID=36839 RepID=A0A1S8MBD6_9CLOT|nr:RIP metalloprotease RseP [Clostridium felsineum]MCR3758542.1 RIP metalloprotease RseP [Clostridium felsineum]URZ00719.1 Regulator of sigma-W protease RasP [Clostridium felsineum]URZ06642.1 Regulator of sigma-W protease RasP [Clostridium felsineum]URZ11675.1 Regulator of sigma-W protease RasP [Clostridium felsineum]URZ16233.1 Regulator of sigma-W protease RasP [Clostridium felsineum DSM 794]